MQYIHAQGIVHLDLKPSNVLLDESYNPFLVDFGLSEFELDGKFEKQKGTSGYIDPLFSQTCNTDPKKCDIYSFGVF